MLSQEPVEFAQPVAPPVDVDDVDVVQQAVEDGGRQDLVAREDLRPVAYVLVRGEDDGALLVAGRDEAKEEVRLLPIQGPEANLVELCGVRGQRPLLPPPFGAKRTHNSLNAD